VARIGFDAVMRGDAEVVAGWKNKVHPRHAQRVSGCGHVAIPDRHVLSKTLGKKVTEAMTARYEAKKKAVLKEERH
jgi:hypothetical protein